MLSGANTYTGVTTISGGILSVASLANGGSASSIGQSANTSTSLVINGGTLRYTGGGASTDRLFKIGATTVGGSATIDASGTGALTFANAGAVTYGTTEQTRFLTLTGSNMGGNTFAPIIADNTITINPGAVALTKSGAGAWTVTAANTFTGGTTISGGTLNLGATNALSNGALAMGGGTLAVNGFNQTLSKLTLLSNALIDFSNQAAALVFGDSSALTWSGTLAVTNYNSANSSLRFGTSSSGLTVGQIGDITLNGAAAAIDANGFIVSAIPEPSTYAVIPGCGGPRRCDHPPEADGEEGGIRNRSSKRVACRDGFIPDGSNTPEFVRAWL